MMRLQPVGRPHRLEQMLLPGAGLVLVFSTLTLGATPPWARAGMELAVLALLGVWLLAGVLRGELSFRLPRLFFPMLAIFLFACLQGYAGLSVYPPATRQEAWELLAVGGFFFLVHNQLTSTIKLERFVTGLLLFAFVLAVFAILQGLSFDGKIYWTWEVPQGSSPYGPFINRNHYAAWALLLVPLAWVKFSQQRRSSELRLFWALVLLTLGISVMFSLSRAGAALFVLFFPLYWFLGRRPAPRGRRRLPRAALAVILLAAGVTLMLDTGRWVSRWQAFGEVFTRPEVVERYRWQIWGDTLTMVGDHRWTGSGLETFGVLSDSYRSFYSNQRWLQAHNDYVQWLAETGLVGAILALWFLVALARAGAEKLRLAPQSRTRQFVLGALTGCLLVLLHSLVDFPLRIPANALLFVALLAVITAPTAGALLSSDPERTRELIGQAEFRVL